MKYRKKNVVVEAMQWQGLHADIIECSDPEAFAAAVLADACHMEDISEFMAEGEHVTWFVSDKIEIDTREGVMTADPGDWIIKGAKGEFYPCKPDIFEKTYEDVE